MMNSLDYGKIVTGPKVSYTPQSGGMGKFFFSKMSSHGDAVAQIDGLTGEKDTYRSLLQRCIRTAITMRDKGITPIDIISICSFNHLNSCVPFIAGLFLTVKTASLDPTISLPETVHLLKQTRPKIIFVGPEAVALIEKALREARINAEIIVFGPSTCHSTFFDFLVASKEEEYFRPVEAANMRDTAGIFFSSGTTGLPKGICLSHLGLLSQGFRLGNTGYKTNIFLAFSSMYWISAALTICCCIIDKGCRLIVPKYDPNIVWDLINDWKITVTFLAPSQAVALYKRGRPNGVDTTNLTDLMIGGGPISKCQIQELQDVLPGTRIVIGYGQTELTGCCTLFRSNNLDDVEMMKRKPASSGRVLPGFAIKVVHTDTEEILGANRKGELRVKSDFQMNGYFGIDSSDAWDADGWLKTGDIGYYDEDYCFFIVDRIKEILKFQSWHIPPAVLENILLTHPNVATAVVVGLPHPEDGDHVMGLVTLKDSAADVMEKEIEHFVAERVDDRQRLRAGVKIVGSIPVTPTGKIKRGDIRNMILKGIL